MAQTHTNRHGRKAGRGVRPWLLIPKVLAMAGFLGSLGSALMLTICLKPHMPEQWEQLIHSLEIIIENLMVPCAFATIVFGVALLALHWRAMIRQRWMRVKAVLVVLCLPACHLWASGLFETIEEKIEHGGSPEGPTGLFEMFQISLATGVLLLIVLIWLGDTSRAWAGAFNRSIDRTH